MVQRRLGFYRYTRVDELCKAKGVRRLHVCPGLDNVCVLVRQLAVPCLIMHYKRILLRFTLQSVFNSFAIKIHIANMQLNQNIYDALFD